MQMEELLSGIDGDLVAFVYQSDCAAHCGLGGNMTYDHAVRSAGKASIGDQADGIAQSCADQRRRRRKHLAHAWSALGTLVSDDNYISRIDLSRQNCSQAFFF